MNLAANESPDKKILLVQPLFFRDIRQFAQASESGANESVVEQPPEKFDFEASLLAAHEKGRKEAIITAEQGIAQRLTMERESIFQSVQQFEQEKQRYFLEIEREVVKLSLAIAERVLHREAKMDPMLLAGAARVALDQVADCSEAVLRVAPSEAESWQQTFGSRSMVIEADEALPRGEVVLKTRSGTVQLGISAQLQEIERGFFELLNRRPPMAA